MPYVVEKPKTLISEELLNELETFTADSGQVIVHGICAAGTEPLFIRIWPTTYLFDAHSDHISELVHFERISGFPTWTLVPPGSEFAFTLIFSGLPKSCTLFDLKEVIPQANGFCVSSIHRNNKDVYYLDFGT